MPLARVFLAGSLKTHPVDGSGRPSPAGQSDVDVLHWFRDQIQRIAGNRVEVILTEDPVNESISEKVRRDIRRSDFMVCVFTKRCEDGLLHNWTTSPYVLSESGYGAACLDRKPHDKQRLFAFVEQGVDRDQLGLAFPRDDRIWPVFNRDKLGDCHSDLGEIVDAILARHKSGRRPYEALTLRKTVTVWRSGWVLVECRYSFRLSMLQGGSISIPHTLWRVSDKLPNIRTLLENRPRHQYERAEGKPFLRCIPVRCGGAPPQNLKCKIVPNGTSAKGNEASFHVQFNTARAVPGDILEYILFWAYPGAFCERQNGDAVFPNSVGLRTGDRGAVGDASLVLKFERDWIDDSPRTVEQPPRWCVNGATSIPAAAEPEMYWHRAAQWEEAGEMVAYEEAEDAAFDAFVWSRSDFHGQVRVTWQPFPNYHTLELEKAPANEGTDHETLTTPA